MSDVTIDLLRLTIEDAIGHEHRIQPIAMRAAEILAVSLDQQSPSRSRHLDAVTAPSLNLDLNHSTDEQAASHIAHAVIEALALHLEA